MVANAQITAISWNWKLSTARKKGCETLDDMHEKVKEVLDRYDVKYTCWGREYGKSNLNPHLQGYTAFSRRYSFLKVTRDFHDSLGDDFWLKVSIKDAWTNIVYCSKEMHEFFEYGTRPKEPSAPKPRIDYAHVLSVLRQGRMAQLESETPQLYLLNYSKLMRVHLESVRPLCRNRKGLWLVGQPGKGKSYYAHKFDPNVYHKNPNSKWFDGYNNQSTIVIDDIDRSNASGLGYYLKIWYDPYPILGEIKGSTLYLEHDVVIVTSNYRIDSLYEDPDLRAALHRRYKEVVVLNHRENPEGGVDILSPDPENPMLTKWYNNVNIFND